MKRMMTVRSLAHNLIDLMHCGLLHPDDHVVLLTYEEDGIKITALPRSFVAGTLIIGTDKKIELLGGKTTVLATVENMEEE